MTDTKAKWNSYIYIYNMIIYDLRLDEMITPPKLSRLGVVMKIANEVSKNKRTCTCIRMHRKDTLSLLQHVHT